MTGYDDWKTREPVSYADEEPFPDPLDDPRLEYDPDDERDRDDFWRNYDSREE